VRFRYQQDILLSMPSRQRTTLLLLALPLVFIGCALLPESTTRQIAMIGGPDLRRIDAPDTVRAGEFFTVTVYSWGSGSRNCNDPDGEIVETRGGIIRITPYDKVPTGEIVCTADLRSYARPLSVRFGAAGAGTIRLVGVVQSRGPASQIDSLERAVVVRP
jgi:hypothetical protein